VAAPRQAALTVLDASALIALLLDEPARPEVEALLLNRPPPLVSAANLAEVIDKLQRVEGHGAEQVNDAVDLLIVGGLEVQPYWLPDARNAAAIRARYYHRTRSPVSLADCACIATALSQHAALATTDPSLARAARQLGVDVISLPDSNGQRTQGPAL
jgi:PIN domain nuclease of toxin-antitoxin system